MDRISSQKPLAFGYSDLTCDGSVLAEPWELYLRVAATFAVCAGNTTIYSESLFPVVEFAIESQIWVATVRSSGGDFIFSSMESEEEGLLWIKAIRSEWYVGSPFCEKPSPPLQLPVIVKALDEFFVSLKDDVAEVFNKDIGSLIQWRAENQVPRFED